MTSRTFNQVTYTTIDATTALVASSTASVPDIETSIEIPLASGNFFTVTTIGALAFQYNSTITSITLPNTIVTIGANAFEETVQLAYVYIPNSVTTIGSLAFIYSNTVPINIVFEAGSSLTSFPVACFASCTFSDPFIIPNSVTSFNTQCFHGCTNLSFTGGSSVTSLGEQCFSQCNFTSLPVFDSVTSLPDFCYHNCPNLVTIVISDNITNLGVECFSNCPNLTTVTIGNSVASFGTACFYENVITTVIWKNQHAVNYTYGSSIFESGTANVTYYNTADYSELSPTSRRIFDDSFSSSTITYIASVLCFGADSKILTFDSNKKEEVYVPVQQLQVGDLVKVVTCGSDNKYKKICHVRASKIFNPGHAKRIKDRLYRCSALQFPELSDDLIITGAHSILVPRLLESERNSIMELFGDIYVTDGHYRLPACVDERTVPYAKEGEMDIYHFALENENIYGNCGVFANGLLVESASIHHLTI
jgi:hypothetical protein